jgi:uncharacterized protein YndB with AHSA1/START domain
MNQELIVVKSVEIVASTDRVWHALTEPDTIEKWMAGARVESTWEVGSDITFRGTMPNFNRKYEDHGTVLAIEPERLLRYSHWSQMSRLPDAPQNRTLVTFLLEPIEDKTQLTVRHENFHFEDEYKHANFFWNVALYMMKNQIEA